jgi:hypothetical protein
MRGHTLASGIRKRAIAGRRIVIFINKNKYL